VGSITLTATNNNTNKLTPVVSIKVNEQRFSSILDTGASHSFVSLNFVDLHNLSINKTNISQVTIANSSQLQIIGTCRFSFSLIGKTFSRKFFVLEQLPVDIILGSDFLHNARLVIDMHNHCFFFSDNKHEIFPFQTNAFLCLLQGLTEKRKVELNHLLHEYKPTLASIGCTDLVQCNLNAVGKPVAQKPYPVSPTERRLIKKHVDEMLKLGIIRPSKSEWASPVTMQKQDNEYRFCLDYRLVNE